MIFPQVHPHTIFYYSNSTTVTWIKKSYKLSFPSIENYKLLSALFAIFSEVRFKFEPSLVFCNKSMRVLSSA